MLEFDTVADMHAFEGKLLGHSEWVTIDQDTIDLFAIATGDHQWVHVDGPRAAREMPDGKTIAHGYLTLAMLPRLGAQIYRIREACRRMNYGSDKIRFTAPVQCDGRIRLQLTMLKAERTGTDSHRFRFSNAVEIFGGAKPALVAETLMLVQTEQGKPNE